MLPSSPSSPVALVAVAQKLPMTYRSTNVAHMRWPEVRAAHPDQWLVIEALEAHSRDAHRVFDRIAVVEVCADGPSTMKRCAQLHRQHPQRELCFVHTTTVELDIEEPRWIGIRRIGAIDVPAVVRGLTIPASAEPERRALVGEVCGEYHGRLLDMRGMERSVA